MGRFKERELRNGTFIRIHPHQTAAQYSLIGLTEYTVDVHAKDVLVLAILREVPGVGGDLRASSYRKPHCLRKSLCSISFLNKDSIS